MVEWSSVGAKGPELYLEGTVFKFSTRRDTTIMERILWPLLATLVLGGCATSTVEKRKEERAAAYAKLSPEFKTAVDVGELKVGMPIDAVYVAWGKPSQIVRGESSSGATTTWLYYGTQLVEYRYWSYGPYWHGSAYYCSPYPAYDYYPRSYVRAEVVFQNGLVSSWRTLPRAAY
jgi:hypothetical protein